MNNKNDITFEYILFQNFNDSLRDADELIKLYRQVPTHLVNIIEYNPIDAAKFQKPDQRRLKIHEPLIEEPGECEAEKKSWKDIDAACGQLANKDTIGVNAG